MRRLFPIVILILLCVISQAQRVPYRNGQRYTGYDFPLSGDVDYIEIVNKAINPDTGKEYPRDTTTIKFNQNGDVIHIYPYIDLSHTDIVYQAELRFTYNEAGYNTVITEIIDFGESDVVYETLYTYDKDGQRIRGENYNEDGDLLYTEDYLYDSQGHLTHEKYYKGSMLSIYTYDDDMNIIEIEEYHEAKLQSKTYRTYDSCGKIVEEAEYTSNRLDEIEIRRTTTYSYDEKGFISSSISKRPIPDIFSEFYKDSRTETTDRRIYRCDPNGNVIEETYYPADSYYPSYRTEYRISYQK